MKPLYDVMEEQRKSLERINQNEQFYPDVTVLESKVCKS